jgi:hypothetical protein
MLNGKGGNSVTNHTRRLCTILFGGGLDFPVMVRDISEGRDGHGELIFLSGTTCIGGRLTPVQTWIPQEQWRRVNCDLRDCARWLQCVD